MLGFIIRGQFLLSGIVIAYVCLSIRACTCSSEFVHAGIEVNMWVKGVPAMNSTWYPKTRVFYTWPLIRLIDNNAETKLNYTMLQYIFSSHIAEYE